MARKTPLGTALGLGSAKDGTEHWWSQRVSAVAVLFLGLWFAFSLVHLLALGASYADVRAWLATPINAIAMIALVLAVAQHSQLGVQVVIEDYVHAKWAKILALVGQRFIHILLAITGVLAVVRIAFGA